MTTKATPRILTITAAQLAFGDVFDIGGEAVTVDSAPRRLGATMAIHCTTDAGQWVTLTLPVDAALVVTRRPEMPDCRRCSGHGEIVTYHPRYGHLDCPEPYVSEICWACAGTGETR